MDSKELLKASLGWLKSLSYGMEDGGIESEEGEQEELDDLISDIEKHLEN